MAGLSYDWLKFQMKMHSDEKWIDGNELKLKNNAYRIHRFNEDRRNDFDFES